nr:ceramide synthase 2-like [Zonotrichia albicollis]
MKQWCHPPLEGGRSPGAVGWGFAVTLPLLSFPLLWAQDFKEQIIHHVATIILISFSWFANYVRAGTLIMALHDSSDYLLESAKMFNYAGWRNTCNNIFIVFAAVFIITRLVILPFWIMHCTMVYPLDLYPAFFGYYFFNFMMVVLQSLHIFWAYLIIRMAQKFITGKVRGGLGMVVF